MDALLAKERLVSLAAQEGVHDEERGELETREGGDTLAERRAEQAPSLPQMAGDKVLSRVGVGVDGVEGVGHALEDFL